MTEWEDFFESVRRLGSGEVGMEWSTAFLNLSSCPFVLFMGLVRDQYGLYVNSIISFFVIYFLFFRANFLDNSSFVFG